MKPAGLKLILAPLLTGAAALALACSNDSSPAGDAPFPGAPGGGVVEPLETPEGAREPEPEGGGVIESLTTPARNGSQAREAGADARLHRAGQAGEVEIRREGNRLVLVAVHVNDGWEYRIDEDDDDEIEVGFRGDGAEVAFEAELDDGRIEIEVTEKFRDAPSGVWSFPGAGEIEMHRDGNRLSTQVRTSGGWSHRLDVNNRDVEVELWRGDDRIEFEAKLQGQRIEIEIKTKLYFD